MRHGRSPAREKGPIEITNSISNFLPLRGTCAQAKCGRLGWLATLAIGWGVLFRSPEWSSVLFSTMLKRSLNAAVQSARIDYSPTYSSNVVGCASSIGCVVWETICARLKLQEFRCEGAYCGTQTARSYFDQSRLCSTPPTCRLRRDLRHHHVSFVSILATCKLLDVISTALYIGIPVFMPWFPNLPQPRCRLIQHIYLDEVPSPSSAT